jgi:hypothetical protein
MSAAAVGAVDAVIAGFEEELLDGGAALRASAGENGHELLLVESASPHLVCPRSLSTPLDARAS